MHTDMDVYTDRHIERHKDKDWIDIDADGKCKYLILNTAATLWKKHIFKVGIYWRACSMSDFSFCNAEHIALLWALKSTVSVSQRTCCLMIKMRPVIRHGGCLRARWPKPQTKLQEVFIERIQRSCKQATQAIRTTKRHKDKATPTQAEQTQPRSLSPPSHTFGAKKTAFGLRKPRETQSNWEQQQQQQQQEEQQEGQHRPSPQAKFVARVHPSLRSQTLLQFHVFLHQPCIERA